MPMDIVQDSGQILHVTQGGNKDIYGDRIPFIKFGTGSTNMLITSAINGDTDYKSHGLPNPIPMYIWTRVEVSQLRQSNGSYQYTIRIDDIIYFQMANTDPREFSDVKVYISDPWMTPAKAKISNFNLTTFPHRE